MSTFVNMTGSSANIQMGAGQARRIGTADLGFRQLRGRNDFSQGHHRISAFGGNARLLQPVRHEHNLERSACVGPSTDNSGLFVCAFDSNCQTSGGIAPHYNDQNQFVIITSVTNSGGGVYTIGFTNGLYMNNWAYSQTPYLNWLSTTYAGIGYGLEEMTILFQSGASQTVSLNGCYDCWVKGLRLIGAAQTGQVNLSSTKNCLVANNYLYEENPTPSSSITIAIDHGSHTDDLILNNVITGGVPF